MEKQHEYNMGDEITVRIAAVTEINGKPAYEIKGIKSIKFSEGGIDAMAVKKIKPGDIIYQVAECEEENILWFDAAEVEDIGTKDIKLFGDWFTIEKLAIFTIEKDAEEYATKLAQEKGYRIVKGGLFEKEDENGD